MTDGAGDRQRELLDHIALMVQYWTDLPIDAQGTTVGLPETREALEWRLGGLAHSILVAFDGGAAVGPYHVIPVQDGEGDQGREKVLALDLAGSLHEHIGSAIDRARSERSWVLDGPRGDGG